MTRGPRATALLCLSWCLALPLLVAWTCWRLLAYWVRGSLLRR